MSDCADGSFYVFGGFVNGYRVDELLKFKPSTMNIECHQLAGGTTECKGPKPRASHASGCFNDHLFVYGGCDDDEKLGDMWEFNPENSTWTEIVQEEGSFVP